MGKRVYEVAKELGKPVNEVIEILKKHNIEKSNFSAADDKDIEIIKKAYAPKPTPKPNVRLVRSAAAAPKAPAAAAVQGGQQQSTRPAGIQGQQRPAGGSTSIRPQGGQQGSRAGGSQNARPVSAQGQQRPAGSNNGNRPQGQQGGRFGSGQGQRPAGGNNGNRPQGQQGGRFGSGQGQRSAGGNNGNRPQGQQGGRFGGGQGQRSGGGNNVTRPQGQQGGRFGGSQGQHSAAKPRNQGGIFVGPGQAASAQSASRGRDERKERRNEPAKGSDRREGGKNAGKSRKNQTPIKGSYATKESRPNRSAGHQMPVNRGKKGAAPKAPVQQVEIIRPSSVEIGESINVQEFAKLIKREVNEVIKALFMLGVMVTINQDIDFETAQLIGSEFEVEVLAKAPEEDPTEIPEVDDDPALRVGRPPVITVMGHVDHGKTSILDVIRKTNVTAREAGGITQHIGAYKVNYQGKQIVFLDTPGHEAFTAMRARGAQVTDIAILVVAADDGVMPQTIEAINHAKAAKVPIVVAINKMDRAGANPDHVKQQLAEQELIPEDWGGDTIMVPCSAHSKEGISDLLDMILLVAEVQDLKANPNLPAHGTIIEAQLDKGRGPVATVLVQRGTLHVGDTIIAGTCYGKVRAMVNDRGEKVKKAGPSTPVEVLGLNDVPQAGDILDSTEERIARSVAEKRIARKKEEEIASSSKVSLDDLFQRIKEGELKELNIVVKADVQGTIEALKASLQKIKNDEVKVVVVHAGVGAITESDVMLASAANALIIGFNVRPDANARKSAEQEKVDLRTYSVIYDALNDVEAAIKGMLAPKFTEVVQGRVEVRQLITISKLLIAGCYVLDGKVTNDSKVRVIRDGIVLPVEDEVSSLRRFKDDVKEVQQGYECGITLAKFRDLKEGDIFEVYAMEEVAAE